MPIFTIEDLRSQMPEFVEKGANDEQLILQYASEIGEDPMELADYFGVETGRDRSAIGAGLSAGLDTLQTIGLGTLAAGAEAFGAEDTADRLMYQAEGQQAQAFLQGKPEYERIEDQESIGDFAGYIPYQIAKGLPIMGGIAATGAITGGVGAAAGLTARAATMAGTGLASYGTGVGSLYGSAYDAYREDGQRPNLGEVFAKALPYAAAEMVLPTAVAGTVTKAGLRPTAATRSQATLQGIGGGFATEAITETAQTGLEISMNPYLSEEEKYSQLLNAAVAGGLSGGAIGGTVGAIAGPTETDLAKSDKPVVEQEVAPVIAAPTEQQELDLGRPTVLETEMQDELGTPDTGLREPVITTPKDAPTQADLEIDDVEQLDLDFTGNELIDNEVSKEYDALKQSIAGIKQLPVGQRKIAERKLAKAEEDLFEAREVIQAIKSSPSKSGKGKARQKRALLNAQKKEAQALEVQQTTKAALDSYEAGTAASDRRKKLQSAFKAYGRVGFDNINQEQQELLREVSPTIASLNPKPESTLDAVEQIENEAVEQSDKKAEVVKEEVEASKEVEDMDVNADEAALIAAMEKLDARYGSEQGKASGKLNLDKRVIQGVVRMLRDNTVEPKARVTVPKTNKTDTEATAQNAEQMELIYAAAMDVVRASKKLYDDEQNAVRSVDPDKPDSSVQLKTARRAIKGRLQLKDKVETFIKAAGSETDAEAIIEAFKSRAELNDARAKKSNPDRFFDIAESIGRTKIESTQGLTEAVDTLLSVPFADYKNNLLDEADVVGSRATRYNKKKEANPAVTKKLREYKTKGYFRDAGGKKLRFKGFEAILESITDAGSTDTLYEKTIAGGIKQALRAMRKEGIKEVKVKFLEDTKDEFPNYNPVTHTITISENASKEEILHEGLHAVTQWWVTANPDSEQVSNLSSALDEIFDAVDDGVLENIDLPTWQKQEALDVIQLLRRLRDEGKENAAVLELVSYGSTMHSLKKVIKGINALDSKPEVGAFYTILGRLWGRLIQVIRAAIGAPESVAQSVVDNTFWILDNVIADADVDSFNQTRKSDKLNYGYDPQSDAMPTTPSGNQNGDINLSNYSRKNRNKVLTFQAFFDLIHWDKGVEFVGSKLTAVADKIREEYPGAQRVISYFNTQFNSNDNATRNIRELKRNIQIPQQSANYISDKLKYESSENVVAILKYLDGDKGAIEGIKDYARLEDMASKLREYIDEFISILPEEEQAFFQEGNFTDSLLFVRTSADVAKSGLRADRISSLIGRQSDSVDLVDIESNPDLYRFEDGRIDYSGKFYKVEVRTNLDSYSVFVDVDVYDQLNGELPITDGMYNTDLDTEYRFSGKVKDKAVFRANRNYKQAMDKAKAEDYATAIENTIHALAHNYATRNFAKAMLTDGYDAGYLLNDEASFEAWKITTNEERVAEGKERVDYKLIKSGDIEAAKQGFTEKFRANTYWVEVPAGYGELSGKIIHGPVWAHITDSTDRSVPFEEIAEITRIYKKTKTVYNPGTQITNIASNVALLMMHDISIRTLADAVKIMYNYQFNPEKMGKMEREIIRQFESTGAIVGNFSAQEVTKAMHTSMQENITSDSDKSVYNQLVTLVKSQFAQGAALGKLGDFANRADKVAVDMYAAGDNAFRLALFMKTIAENTEGREITQADYNEAAEVSKKGFMDYDIDEKAVRYLRATALPFVSWFFRATQVVGKLAVTKPWKLAKLLTMWAMLDALMAGMAGDDEERRKAGDPKLQDRLLGFGPNMHMRIPFLGDGDEAVYYRIGDYFPLATSFNGLPNGFAGIDWWPSAVNPSGPLLSGIAILIGGVNPYTGQKLSGPTDTTADAFMERMYALYDTMGVPALRSTNLSTMYDMAFEGGKKDVMGRELSWTYLALAKVGGLKIIEHSDAKEATLRQIRASKVMREFDQAISKARRDALKTGSIDFEALDAEILDLYARRQDEINEIYQIEDE